jgi:hypothetical protein
MYSSLSHLYGFKSSYNSLYIYIMHHLYELNLDMFTFDTFSKNYEIFQYDILNHMISFGPEGLLGPKRVNKYPPNCISFIVAH